MLCPKVYQSYGLLFIQIVCYILKTLIKEKHSHLTQD